MFSHIDASQYCYLGFRAHHLISSMDHLESAASWARELAANSTVLPKAVGALSAAAVGCALWRLKK